MIDLPRIEVAKDRRRGVYGRYQIAFDPPLPLAPKVSLTACVMVQLGVVQIIFTVDTPNSTGL